jgi:outer membrane protein OmpA-like peptidoglycan-associated protein
MATTALALAFAVPMAPAFAAGPFDGVWIIDVPNSIVTGDSVPTCPAQRLTMRISDSQVTGNFDRVAAGEDNVVENGRQNASGVSGSVQPDGVIATRWQNFHAEGKLTGNQAQLTMQSECGPMIATGRRVRDNSMAVATTASSTALVATTTATASSQSSAYNVYFEFDKAKLTPEARQIIKAAVLARGNDQNGSVTLLGKADLSGTDPYNMALSQRRADAVRNAMVADGSSVNLIDVKWDGDRAPPVPTAAGVREARNRVVEIAIQ